MVTEWKRRDESIINTSGFEAMIISRMGFIVVAVSLLVSHVINGYQLILVYGPYCYCNTTSLVYLARGGAFILLLFLLFKNLTRMIMAKHIDTCIDKVNDKVMSVAATISLTAVARGQLLGGS